MKYLFSILSLFLSISISVAQSKVPDSLSQTIIGTWQLENPDKSVSIKIFTGGHYTQVSYVPVSGTQMNSVTGKYSLTHLDGGTDYKEMSLCVTRGLEAQLNKPKTKSVGIDAEGRLIFSWNSGGSGHQEIWRRVSKEPVERDTTMITLHNQLTGGWDLITYNDGKGFVMDQKTHNFRRFKLYDGSRFSVADIDPQSNITRTAFTGNYSLGTEEGGDATYVENQLPIADQLPEGPEKKFEAGIEFVGDDLMTLKWTDGNVTSSETWMRMLSSQELPENPHPNALYLVKVGEKFIRLKPNADFPDPFSAFDQKDILSQEYIHDATAIRRFGKDGLHGVLLIGVKDSTLTNLLKKLRVQKSIY